MIEPWVLWAFAANASIQWVEYANRHLGDGSWVSVLPLTLPAIVLSQFGIFQTFRHAPHWMVGWCVFTLGNSMMRIVLVKLTGQPVDSWFSVVAGITMMLAGALWMKEGLA